MWKQKCQRIVKTLLKNNIGALSLPDGVVFGVRRNKYTKETK